jgi:YesN/AraC family two-component response regulator
VLVEKNVEIIETQKNHPEKPKKSGLTDDMQNKLLEKILLIMKDTPAICNPKFSINTLAGLVQANHIYVSVVIHIVLGQNFRSFLNSYRIKEAQRLFSEPESAKYTIEGVALQVGYKSRTTFREAFKEVTGVTPTFYLTQIQGQVKS